MQGSLPKKRQLRHAKPGGSLDYRLMLDGLADAVVGADASNRVVYVNAAAEQLLGWRADDLVGQPLANIQPPRLRARHSSPFTRYIETRESDIAGPGLRVLVLHRDGSEIEVELSLATVPTHEPDGGLVVASMRDVRQRVEIERSEERLRQQLELTAAITRNLAGGVSAFDRRGRLAFMNPAAERMLGWTESELRGRDVHEILHGSPGHEVDVCGAECALRRALSSDTTVRVHEDQFMRRDGVTFPVAYTASPLDVGDYPVGHVLAFQDMTERRQAEAALRESQESFRHLFASSPLPMWVYDKEGLQFLEVNEAATRHYGYSRDEFLSMRVTDIRPAEDAARLLRLLKRPRSEIEQLQQWRHRLKDGTIIDVEVVAHMLHFSGREAILVLAQDITERKRAAEALQHQAFHDALTGLPNRTLLLDRLEQGIRAAQRGHSSVALLFLDLNHFKDVNDTLGHQYGDLVLIEIGQRIRETLRESDTIARLSGDEFAVLLPEADERGATLAAGKILRALGRPFILQGQSFEVGASIGVAIYPDHGQDAATLMARADRAMYAAKRTKTGYAVSHSQESEDRSHQAN